MHEDFKDLSLEEKTKRIAQWAIESLKEGIAESIKDDKTREALATMTHDEVVKWYMNVVATTMGQDANSDYISRLILRIEMYLERQRAMPLLMISAWTEASITNTVIAVQRMVKDGKVEVNAAENLSADKNLTEVIVRYSQNIWPKERLSGSDCSRAYYWAEVAAYVFFGIVIGAVLRSV